MGTYVHYAIVCRSNDAEDLAHVQAKASELFENEQTGFELGSLVSPILHPGGNGECSFYVAPDGSKLGWSTHESIAQRREQFLAWLETEHGGESVEWVEVNFGTYEREAMVTADTYAALHQEKHTRTT